MWEVSGVCVFTMEHAVKNSTAKIKVIHANKNFCLVLFFDNKLKLPKPIQLLSPSCKSGYTWAYIIVHMLNNQEVTGNIDSERFFLLNLIWCYAVYQAMYSMQHGPQKIELYHSHILCKEIQCWNTLQYLKHWINFTSAVHIKKSDYK